MKISEAIEVLSEALEEHGDLELIQVTEVDGRYYYESGKTLQVIDFPEEDDRRVMALIFYNDNDEDEEN